MVQPGSRHQPSNPLRCHPAQPNPARPDQLNKSNTHPPPLLPSSSSRNLASLAASPKNQESPVAPTPRPRSSGAPTRPPASLLGIFSSSPSRKENEEPPWPLPPFAGVLHDFLRKVVVLVLDAEGVINKTMGFNWVDDDGWVFSPALWGDVDEASRRAPRHPAVRRCCHREARAVRFLDSTKGWGAWAFGWYGAAARDVQVAADGGDLAVNWPLLGAGRAHGRGIHLSVQGKPMPR
ncbi:putative inactive poly [Panicum miliaceum]|uniref:Inactive poly n=1 Tax=Panicum miliaceum TaxID=4540 RepID=A0A3L6SPN8_PANMI|nr:putative inactive poly [Panicum miliaceum]